MASLFGLRYKHMSGFGYLGLFYGIRDMGLGKRGYGEGGSHKEDNGRGQGGGGGIGIIYHEMVSSIQDL